MRHSLPSGWGSSPPDGVLQGGGIVLHRCDGVFCGGGVVLCCGDGALLGGFCVSVAEVQNSKSQDQIEVNKNDK